MLSAALRDAWETLRQSSEEGIEGVKRITIGNPEHRLVCVMMTHGNEPAGLAFFSYVLAHQDLFQDVDLTFVLANVRASTNYFEGASESIRFTEWDMNRMPAEFPACVKEDSPYEWQRALELHTLFAGASIHSTFDIHSTPQYSPGMILDFAAGDSLASAFCMKRRITGLYEVQSGMNSHTRPLVTTWPSTTTLSIETGQHESEAGIRRAILNGILWLSYMGCVRGETTEATITQHHYNVISSLMLPEPDFTYKIVDEKFLVLGTQVDQGELIARNNRGHEIHAPVNGVIVLGTNRADFQPRPYISEFLWLAEGPFDIPCTIKCPQFAADMLKAELMQSAF